MSKLKITKYGEPILRKKTDTIFEINSDIEKLAYDMLETMYFASGVGLAATQVGISLDLCVIDIDLNKKSPLIMINPKIIFSSENNISTEEGCLSLPKFYEIVSRPDEVIVEYVDVKGKKMKIKATGLLARVMQHEIDHLNAKIFIDYLPKWRIKVIEKEIKRKKRTGDW
ncbi:MAG: peptide deformylase [Endomicrobium sp.]|nr:peptide deformylase [Endomicrobium sp.]